MKSTLRFLAFLLFVSVCVAALYVYKHPELLNGRVLINVNDKRESAAPDLPPLPPVTSTTQNAAPAPTGGNTLLALDEQFTSAVQKVLPSVVSIDATPRTRQISSSPFAARSESSPSQMGSGVIVSDQGHVVSNLHVVRGADAIRVTLNDGRVFPATLQGSDKATDIAVLKIDAEAVQPLRFGDSDSVRAGQIVFAIGNPFGLQESVSQGIVSGVGRRAMNESLNEYIQTDSAVNPGNSGGPLINVRGEVIGINNFIFSQDGGSLGIGFAIPSNSVRKIFEDIVMHGRVIRPYLGVSFSPVTAQVVRSLRLPDDRGALIRDVENDSPAEQAGLRAGDVVRMFRGKTIHDQIDFRNRVIESAIGQTAQVRIFRDGREQDLTIAVTEASLSAETVMLPVRPPGERAPLDGVVAADLTPKLASRWNIPVNLAGVLVIDLQEGSPLARVLQPGDVIMEISGKPIQTKEDFLRVAAELPINARTQAVIARNNYRFRVPLDPR